MKIKHIYKFLLVGLVAVIMGACTSTEADPKFDESPIERLNARKKELNDLLLSSADGWKAVYYTDSTQLGAWTHLFKFLPDGKVDMASDFDDDTDIHRSQYDIQLGSAVSLVFTTANRIHLLSESDNYPTPALVGKGHLGDFQFFYYGQENGEIIFRTNRSFQELRFKKATAKDWDDLHDNTPVIEAITGEITSPLFRLLEINDGAAVQNYDLDYNPDARFGVAASLVPGSNDLINMSFAFTPAGAVVEPPVEVKGQKLTNFSYNSTDDTFVSTGTGGVKATIKYTTVPPVITDDYKKGIDGQPQFVISYIAANLYSAPTTSNYFRSLILKANAALPANQSIARIQIYFNSAFGNYIEYRFNGGRPSVYHNFTTTPNNTAKTLVFNHDSWDNGSAIIPAPAFLKDLDAEFFTPAGMYIKKENFTISFINTIYTMTSASSSFRTTTYQL
ncbi:DUF4302 domain-containing protein [Flavobacterium johnsoniae]|jgi:hypothetical protein|uniref:Hypothetical lipoprotein n=1 Tax=Flavobacterium johnsoniae (strain ATCC 17061 / DSM 2064 / JCM 8514 / BCRC 14874 / CCUG 350202 / NBRC 14942 / NCIMB 11054 / UW101) TaxID=376686 RepID=A5FFW4_FLAJ1|nr:DUF4302 domain-containing protein [Flavobacterium johnsoniae]ABQ05912.1 hypothetical lipoprotein [Flavobacterium johnsoniae UW101]OXE95521.1 hypothetical protein B0A63_24195 [Flavobacterium johnsoniae UW101]WQG81649.1 DUF4302 domain-containing protein [Flavobacterium johnsoniae UW101]SHK59821.1 protein of unknown function [Flavobacterium johnsoniae]